MSRPVVLILAAAAGALAVAVVRSRQTTSLVMAPGGAAPEPNTGPG